MTFAGRPITAILSGQWASVGLFVLVMLAALRIGRTLILPILMAVPLTARLQVMADRIEPLKPVGEMLGP